MEDKIFPENNLKLFFFLWNFLFNIQVFNSFVQQPLVYRPTS